MNKQAVMEQIKRYRDAVDGTAQKLLDCMGGSHKFVTGCSTHGCTLHPFRFGTNPNYPPGKAKNFAREPQLLEVF